LQVHVCCCSVSLTADASWPLHRVLSDFFCFVFCINLLCASHLKHFACFAGTAAESPKKNDS